MEEGVLINSLAATGSVAISGTTEVTGKSDVDEVDVAGFEKGDDDNEDEDKDKDDDDDGDDDEAGCLAARSANMFSTSCVANNRFG